MLRGALGGGCVKMEKAKLTHTRGIGFLNKFWEKCVCDKERYLRGAAAPRASVC